MNIHQLIDQFAKVVAASGNTIEPIDTALWVLKLEERLATTFAPSFRSLVTRYAFPPFEVGGLSFFGNMGTDDVDELSVAIFQDQLLADVTMRGGYIQFARLETGSYDPVCFDTRKFTNNHEYPVVRLDHEAILCREQIRVSERVADSFYRFVTDIVSGAK